MKRHPRALKLVQDELQDESIQEEQQASEEACANQGLPSGWRKGALLNVRNHGDEYIITLYPEEYDREHPERSIRYTNLGECQDFVSRWYAAEHHDPRAR